MTKALEIADLRLVVAAAEAGSFRRAASLLGIDVATLSRRVARLENDLGVLLFERGQAGVRVTQAGASTLTLARRAIADVDAILLNAEQNGRSEKGRLRLGSHLSTIGPRLRQLLTSWRSEHPGVDLELVEIDDRALLVGLRERELSAIIALDPVATTDLASLRLWTQPLLVALPEGHTLAQKKGIAWADLRTLPLLVRTWCGSAHYREIQAELVGPRAQFQPHTAGTFNLLNLVAMGEGAMIALECHREMAIPGIVFRPIDEADATISVLLMWYAAVEDPIAGSFVAFVRDWLRDHG